MPLLDFSKNCNISTIPFVDDLKAYSLTKDNKIVWEEEGLDASVYTIKNQLNLFDSTDTKEYWVPNFIQKDDLIDNKIISHYGVVRGDSPFASGRVGIEDFITFDPKFKNWNTNGKMTIDWILNRSRVPYYVFAGLNYWKIKSTSVTGKIESFPIYSHIKHNNIEYIKLDNNILKKITVNNSIFRNGTIDKDSDIVFKYTEADANTPVSSLGNSPDFTLVGSDTVKLWIPDGDQLLYYINSAEKIKNKIDKISSRSYVSGSLYKYYNIFYNVLTANEKTIKLDDTRSINKLRLYKKLAHSLATSPFSSEFFVSFLTRPSKSIKEALAAYLSTTPISTEQEIQDLQKVLIAISKEYSKYEVVNNSNIVTNNNELFSKLLNKYGAKLKLSGQDAYISYIPNLKYGDSVLIEEIGETLVDKNIKNSDIINNKKISTNNLILETKLSKESCSLLLKTKLRDNNLDTSNLVPLYNSVKPDLKAGSNINILLSRNTNGSDASLTQDVPVGTNIFYWDAPTNIQDIKENWEKYSPRLSVLQLDLLIKYNDAVLPDQAYDMVSNEFFCTWEKISGPPAKFIDINKTQTNKKYNRAYGPEVLFVPSSTGKYIIRCSISSPYGSYTKIKTLFIVDGRKQLPDGIGGKIDNPYFRSYSNGNVTDNLFNFYTKTSIDTEFSKNRTTVDVGKINVEYSSENSPLIINPDNLKIYTFGLDSFALHKNGMFAPIKTSYYVEKITSNSRVIDKLNENYKFTYSNVIPSQESSNLKIEYLCGQTILKLDRIILKNIRNETEECSQCYSLYRPKFKSDNRLNARPRFDRSNKQPDGFTLQRYIFVNENNFNQFDRYITQGYGYPELSSDYAPRIKTCGGYGNQVLDKIQINTKDIKDLQLPNKIDANKGILALDAKSLPPITGYRLDYKDDYTTLDDKFRDYKFCYQQHVMPSGSISFKKGTFVPESGWINSDSGNLSSVLKFNPGARKSFNFMGPGILGLTNYTNSTNISANIFSSSIELNINPLIRWDTGGILCTSNNEEQTKTETAAIHNKHYVDGQLKKELADQYIGSSNQYQHGYRILNGGQPKSAERNLAHNSVPQNDEFDINIDENSNRFIYSFNVVGPANSSQKFNPSGLTEEESQALSNEENKEIEKIDDEYNNLSQPLSEATLEEKRIRLDDIREKYKQKKEEIIKEKIEFADLYFKQGVGPGPNDDGKKIRDYIIKYQGQSFPLRNPRINDLKIQDIEIQLNFLNYVNTKNIAVWLELGYSAASKKSIQAVSRSIPAQVTSPNLFIDQFISNDTYKGFGVSYNDIASSNPFLSIQDTTAINSFTTSDKIPISNTELKTYLKNLVDTNSRDNPGENLILFLLNQETVQNKEYNFSVKFSDTANKHNVLFDHNLFSSGIVDADQNIVSNNHTITPSKNAIGNDTYNYTKYSNAIKFNNLNINNNTFNKFRGKSLFVGTNPDTREGCTYLHVPYDSSTTFTLHIALLDEEDEMFPMDTIINNEIYTNLASVENKSTSANLFNNLCSWELILHTEDVKKPIPKQVTSLASYGGADALSSIEYGKDPQYPGYGFIADLSDSKFLLPLVNMNAPTTFFQNYNACEYADNEIIGKGSIIGQPRFPTEALLFIVTGTAVGGMTGSLVGVLVGGLGPTYYAGFELLYDYYRQSRTVPLLELAQRETFDIDYEAYPFGDSDKILINASKDGIFWYKIEASIFKLSNTPALPLKTYTFIKNKSNLFKFAFNIISNNSDIIDKIFAPYCKTHITHDIRRQIAIERNAIQKQHDGPPIPPLYTRLGLHAQIMELNVEEAQLDQDIANKAYDNVDNPVYNSARVDFMTVDELLSYNRLIGHKNIFQSKKDSKVLIIIDHTLPYYLIDIGDKISFVAEIAKTSSVESKALVYKDGSYKTILALKESYNKDKTTTISSYSEFYLPENIVAIFDNNLSTTDRQIESPVSLFGLSNDQAPYDSVPDFTFSTNSLGSYGDGSSIKDKNILTRKVLVNTIDPIYEQLNSFNNDKYNFNQIKIVLPSGNTESIMAPQSVPTGAPISIKSSFAAYPIYYDNKTNTVLDNKFYHLMQGGGESTESPDLTLAELDERLNNINSFTKDYRTYSKDHKYNMMYLKIQNNNTIDSLFRNTIGTLTIENNYTYRDTVHRITEDELKKLTERLDKLNVIENTALDTSIGIPAQTANVLASDSIKYIQDHYSNLPEDNADCSRSSPVITCNKERTYSKLQKLYTERTQILELLENQTIRKAKIFKTKKDFDDNKFIEDIIDFNNSTSIKIKNQNILQKEDLYLINYIYILDPIKQKYHTGNDGIIPDRKADININPDNSISIEYNKVSDNYYWINIDPKQSCSIAEESRPRVLKSIKYNCESTNPVFSAVGGGVQISDFNNICPDWVKVGDKEGDIFKIQASPDGTTYNIKEEIINQQKNIWGNKVYGWKTQTISRKFRINTEQTIKNILPNIELLVTTTETYDVGLTQLEAAEEAFAKAGLSPSEIIEDLIEEGFIKNDFSGDVREGLLNGIGNNIRNSKPSRVYNIFNLDDTKDLKIQFRKVPRLMRGIDAIGTVLRYGENSSYRPQNRPPLDPLDIWGIGRTESLINNFYLWKCFQKDPSQDKVVEAETPDFFRALNEMAFRTFFGSVDEIENKNSKLKSLYDFEMIPYEYFTKPLPEPPAT